MARGRRDNDRVARESHYASSTVRWTCWPALLRAKLFTDPVLHRMVALMDAAEEAARNARDPVCAKRVEQAAATSVDSLLLEDAGELTRVRDPRDGTLWLVPGGRGDFPRRIERLAEAHLRAQGAGAEPWHFRYRKRPRPTCRSSS